MKKTILFLAIAGISFLNAQEGEIIYKTDFVRETMDDSERGKKLIRAILEKEFSLRYTRTESFFEETPYIAEDQFNANMASVATNSSRDWYQNPKERKSYFNDKVAGKKYLVVFNYRMKGWELTNETKKIEQYTCYKAILKVFDERRSKEYVFVAWYTPEIPAPYGPAGFGGLPGLILEFKNGQVVFIAKKILLNPKKGIKSYPKLSMENPIDEKELARLMRKNRQVTPN